VSFFNRRLGHVLNFFLALVKGLSKHTLHELFAITSGRLGKPPIAWF
jgi:hypothetical protein